MNIVFVCTGNTCRSPMAEGYLKSKNIGNLTVSSRGFGANGDKVSENSATVMRECGIDISSHTSKRLTTDDVTKADLIFCMTENHKQALISCGVLQSKLYVLGDGIPDPFGSDIQTYRKSRDSIFAAIDELIETGIFYDAHIDMASSDDVDDIADIELAVFSTPWSKMAISESLAAGTKFFIATKCGKTVGYAGVSIIAGEAYVTNVAVYPEYRGCGVGKKLTLAMIDYAKKNGAEFISLEVRVSNNTAISLYQKSRFSRVGIRKNFYTNPREDAIIMTRRFTDEDISN